MIEAISLTKRYGAKTVVDDLSFRVEPGIVTGFLGPNGSGKSTTMRMVLGLDRPTSGRATVNGKPYAEHAAPLHEVGALLDATAVHPARSARNHLRVIAATHGISRRRVDTVLELTGLAAAADKRAGSFSLGMGQRLGIATALLGDPQTLILDEPVNGLDPEGVVWVRELARSLAAEGRAVLLSSHLMSEMAQTADHLVVIGQGRIIRNAPVRDILAEAGGDTVRVRTTDLHRLDGVLRNAGATVTMTAADAAEVRGLPVERVAEAAAATGIVLVELTPVTATLEDAFFALTHNAVEYRADAGRASTADAIASTSTHQEIR